MDNAALFIVTVERLTPELGPTTGVFCNSCYLTSRLAIIMIVRLCWGCFPGYFQLRFKFTVLGTHIHDGELAERDGDVVILETIRRVLHSRFHLELVSECEPELLLFCLFVLVLFLFVLVVCLFVCLWVFLYVSFFVCFVGFFLIYTLFIFP